ncbi:suppressor of fused domain protein [Nocardia sp. NPDC050712]|uniref:suppressor of fused domain protein n=1 Tax=Nocardia sp. NPDC050712 TaxID=3155518 RepID=UPI0033FEEC5B
MSGRPGWEAIEGALSELYGGVDPRRWLAEDPWSAGGAEPLDGVYAYACTEPVPHWHYVSFGMSELYEKEWDNPAESGWGFEFTFRLVREDGELRAPQWPVRFLQNLARYVFQSGKRFEPGHTIKSSGPIADDRPESLIHAVGFVVDPELGVLQAPFGRVEFRQLVGLTMTEYRATLGGKLNALLGGMSEQLPMYVTDMGRRSLIPEPKPQASWPRWGGGLRGRA